MSEIQDDDATEERISRLFHAAQEPLAPLVEIRFESGGHAGRVAMLDGHRPHVLGRDPSCDVPADPVLDARVSAAHAEIVVSREQVWIRDLDSRNGTYVNDGRIECPTRLREGDRIVLGRGGPLLSVRLVEPDAEAGAEARPFSPDFAGDYPPTVADD